jgi:hypothetical protein
MSSDEKEAKQNSLLPGHRGGEARERWEGQHVKEGSTRGAETDLREKVVGLNLKQDETGSARKTLEALNECGDEEQRGRSSSDGLNIYRWRGSACGQKGLVLM